MNRLTMGRFVSFFVGLVLAGCSTAAPPTVSTPMPAPTAATARTLPPTTAPTAIPEATPALPTATAALPTTPPASSTPNGPTTVVLSTRHDTEPGITIAVASGWKRDDHGRLYKGNEVNDVPEAMMLVWSFPVGTRFHVWGDPCHWESTQPKNPATSVDQFAADLAGQKSRDASQPVDVTIGGYAGKSVTLHVPQDAVFDNCEGHGFQTYGTDEDPGARSQQGPGQIDELWLTNVNGSPVVIDAMYRPDTPADFVAEMQSMEQSITFDPPPSAGSPNHVLADSADGGVGIKVDLPVTGWEGDPGGWTLEWGPDGFDPPAGAGIIAYVVDKKFYVYGDPCQWKSTRPDTPATTVDELVTALANQSSRDASAPETIATVDGHSGKKITLDVPADADLSKCDDAEFATFGVPVEDPALRAQGPGEIDEIWIVDVNGKVALVEAGYFAGTPQNAVDELHSIMSSAIFN